MKNLIFLLILFPVLSFAQSRYYFDKLVSYDSGKVGDKTVSPYHIFMSSENPDLSMVIVFGEKGVLKDIKNRVTHTFVITSEKNGDLSFGYEYSVKFEKEKKTAVPSYALTKISDDTFEVKTEATRLHRAMRMNMKTRKGVPPFENQIVGEGSLELTRLISQELQQKYGPLEIIEVTKFIGKKDAYFKKRKNVQEVQFTVEAPKNLTFRVMRNGSQL